MLTEDSQAMEMRSGELGKAQEGYLEKGGTSRIYQL